MTCFFVQGLLEYSGFVLHTNPGHDGKVSAGKLAREIIDLSENFPGCFELLTDLDAA